ncbi:hypothetical protein [Duganella sp. BuS-21]|uniref:hypothetical protein n=1 Tax=Duganella sp. BuS-21 TaxID=2943848 RepID=UPI0035A5F227
MTTANNPFLHLMAPLSGDVWQRIYSPWFSPALTFNFAGDEAVEARVVADVASYGKQIGWLNEIVLAQLEGKAPKAEVVNKLTNAVAKIEEIKKGKKNEAYRAAVTALDFLADSQPELYKDLVEKRHSGVAK